jgi:hypothetical protein
VIVGAIGQIIATIGLTTAIRSYPLYLLGSEGMLMSITYEAIWFKNKEASIAMTAGSFSEVIFGTIVFFANPHIFDKTKSLANCYAIISIICVFSVCCALILFTFLF